MNKKNVILITIDCLRSDFTQLASNYDINLPNLRKLTGDKSSSTNVITTGPNTPLAFPAILASTYASMHNAGMKLSSNIPTIAEVLSEEGYVTGGFHSNPHLIAKFGHGRGFDHFHDFMKSDMNRITKYIRSFRRRSKDLVGDLPFGEGLIDLIADNNTLNKLVSPLVSRKPPYDQAQSLNKKVINFISETRKDGRDEPFFLWIHYMDLHVPYILHDTAKRIIDEHGFGYINFPRLEEKAKNKPLELTKSERKALQLIYLSQLKHIDSKLNVLLDFFSNLESENTKIIITADHGEELLEHNLFGHAPASYSDAKTSYLYNTVLEVPFSVFPKGEKKLRENLNSTLDIPVTILDILGLKPPREWLGKTLFKEQINRDYVLSEQIYSEGGSFSGIFAIQNSERKYLYSLKDQELAYFDLNGDPHENNKKLVHEDTSFTEIIDYFQSHLTSIDNLSKFIVDLPDGEQKDRLEDLGYL